MTVRAARRLTAGLVGVLSAAALGCGSDSQLLRDAQSAGLKDALEEVRSAVEGRDCDRARDGIKRLRAEIGALGGDVDRGLRQRLREDVVTKLAPAVDEECDDPLTETIPTTTTEAPTGPTGPVTPEPAPTPEPTPEPEPTTTETVPPPVEPPVEPAPETPPADGSGGFGETNPNGKKKGGG